MHATRSTSLRGIKEREGVEIDPDSIFDVQTASASKVQASLLNAFYVLDPYFQHDDLTLIPRTVMFGAKAFPATSAPRPSLFHQRHWRAGEQTTATSTVASRPLNHNYNVSPAEHHPRRRRLCLRSRWLARSGLGIQHEFMMNGAHPGGNWMALVLRLEAVGADNAYIFGATDDERPSCVVTSRSPLGYENVPGLQARH